MRIVLPVLFAVLFIASCGGKNKVPKGILPPEKMRATFWDVLQADEFLRDYMLNKDSTLNDTTESIRMYARVFRFHKTTREEFARSFQYYKTHGSLMKEMLDSLNVKGQRASDEASRPKPILDTNAVRKVRPAPGVR